MTTEADYSGQSEVYNDPSAPDGQRLLRAQYGQRTIQTARIQVFVEIHGCFLCGG